MGHTYYHHHPHYHHHHYHHHHHYIHLLVQSLAIAAGHHPVRLRLEVQRALLRGGGLEARGGGHRGHRGLEARGPPREGAEPGCGLCQSATCPRHQGLVILILKVQI